MNKISVPLKILFCHYAIIDKEGFGRTFMFARELSARGHEVTMLTVCPAGTGVFFPYVENREKVKLVIFPDILPDFLRRTGFGLLSIFYKFLYVSNKRFDIVHADNGHRPSGGWPARFHRLLHGSKYVTEWWDFFGRGGQFDDLTNVKKITKGYYDLLFEVSDKKKADFVIVLSEQMKVRALESGIPEQKIKVINGGADAENIRYIPHTSAREKWGIHQSALVFGFIGMNEGEFNDVIPFVQAISNLKKSISVKWFTTGRLLSEALKVRYNVGDELIEMGWLDYNSYGEAISCADVFLLTQFDSTCNKTRWPNKVGDYLAAGRLILTNPVGDIQKIALEYPNVFLQCSFSSEDFEKKILELCATKDSLISRGKQSRELAENEMSWSTKTKTLEIVYQKLLEKK